MQPDGSETPQPLDLRPVIVNVPPLCGTWTVVPPPRLDLQSDMLNIEAVSAVSPTDAWIIGYDGDPGLEMSEIRPVILHWDGASLEQVPAPAIPSDNILLEDIVALAVDDAWAVASYFPEGDANQQAAFMHWNGSRWDLAPSPVLPGFSPTLSRLAAVSANDIWAAGHYFEGRQWQPLFVHWDGTRWEQVPGPRLDEGSATLSGLAAISADDVWATGDVVYMEGKSPHFRVYHRTLAAHWDGHRWSIVPAPDSFDGDNYLGGVAGTGGGDVWATGWGAERPGKEGLAGGSLMLHWDGTAWSAVPTPQLSVSQYLAGIAAVTTSDAWAVGSANYPDGRALPFALHWDGEAWRDVPLPNPGAWSSFKRILAVSRDEIWAVGEADNQVLFARFKREDCPSR